MTAQIAILNKSAVALATDSAVTIGGSLDKKTYNTVNKLFTLSKYAPVGIMFYGNAEFMGVPWETIVKSYRADLGSKRFKLLEDYATSFIEYLGKMTGNFPPDQQQRCIELHFSHYLSAIRNDIDKDVAALFWSGRQVTSLIVHQVFRKVLKHYCRKLRLQPLLPQFDKTFRRNIIVTYKRTIEKLSAKIFQRHYRDAIDKALLRYISVASFCRAGFSGAHSGIVFAGYGENDFFPKLRSYLVDGIVNGKLKFKQDKDTDVSFKNGASIIPFAQADMVSEFMEGVHPTFVEFFQERLGEVFRILPKEMLTCFQLADPTCSEALQKKLDALFQQLLSDLNKDQSRFRQERHINPVIKTVAVLPKEELSIMAEALVNLTQFRQKITLQTETVGGPIDVAVISKGDGFVWIRRKHYFNMDLNPFFMHNYFNDLNREV